MQPSYRQWNVDSNKALLPKSTLHFLIPSSLRLKGKILEVSCPRPYYTLLAVKQWKSWEIHPCTTWWNRAILTSLDTPAQTFPWKRKLTSQLLKSSRGSHANILINTSIKHRSDSVINARKTKRTKKLIVLCATNSISQPLDLSHGYHRLQSSVRKPVTHSSSSLPMSSHISSSSHVSLCSLFSFTTLTLVQVLSSTSPRAGTFCLQGPQSYSRPNVR